MGQALCLLVNSGYRNTLRIRTTFTFSQQCLREGDWILRLCACCLPCIQFVQHIYQTARETRRDRDKIVVFSAASTSSPPLFSKACGLQHSQTYSRSCNKQDRERKFQRKIRLRSCGNLAVLPTGNDISLKYFTSCKSSLILRKQIFWVITPLGCVIFFRYMAGMYRLLSQCYECLN